LVYAEQLERKRHLLSELLRASLGHDAPVVEPVIGMRPDSTGWPWGFRHKASFVFGETRDRRSSVIGHFAARSNDIIPIVECPVHAGRANHIAFALHDHLSRARITAAGSALHGVLRHLIVRTTRDEREAVAMLVVTRNDKTLRKPIRAFLDTEAAPDGFYLNVHDRADSYMVGRETLRLAGRSHVKETIGGLSFLVSPTAFFQTNVEAAQVLLDLALEDVPRDGSLRVLDLFAGSGLFTLPLVAQGHRVVSIEENSQAVRDAQSNLRLNRLPAENVRFLASRVEDSLRHLQRDAFDLVVLDPPRQGCPAEVIDMIFSGARPARVVYVSCNPDALALDLPAIVDAGYTIERVQPVDMFPHTVHIETVVRLQRTATDAGLRRTDAVSASRSFSPRRRGSEPGRRGSATHSQRPRREQTPTARVP
jgi:23S rRNA (uracil1939-C5)-methyltransferase